MLFVSQITIVGVIYSMALNAVTFPMLAALIWTNRRNERVLSPHFIVNLCTYLLGIVFCTPYCAYIGFYWNGDASRYSMLVMFWTGTIFYAHAASLSTSVLFLTWDRCFSLMFPMDYSSERRRQLCFWNVGAQLFAYAFIVVWEMGSMPAATVYSSCMSYGCASDTTAYKITYLKVFFATTNSLSAAVFLWIFFRYNAHRQQKSHTNQKNNRNANRLAAFTLCLELVFSCLPNGVSFAVWWADSILLSPMLGPYLAYVFATEVFVVTIVYARVIGIRVNGGRIFAKSTSKSAVVVIGADRRRSSAPPPTILFF